MPRERHTPTRTCVGCRSGRPANELVRLVAPDGRVIVFARWRPASRAVGRGAWIHPRMECVSAALKTKAFSRAFRRGVELPTAGEFVAELSNAFGRGPSSHEQGDKT